MLHTAGHLEAVRAAAYVAGALTIIIALGGCGSSAAAQQSWQRPVNLSAPSAEGDLPTVAMNPAGDTVVVWVEDGSTVVAVVRRAGKAFSAPKRVSGGGVDDEIAYPTVAMDDAGTAIAAWQRSSPDGEPTVVQAAVLPVDGRFSRPVKLSGAHSAFGAAVAATGAGKAIVTWTQKTKSGDVVRAATRAGPGGFSRPASLSANGQDVGFSGVAMNAAGDAIVAWSRGPRKRHVVQAALRPARGSFARPVNLTAARDDVSAAGVAIDPSGNAIAVWTWFNGTNSIVQAVARPARGAFSIPVDVSEPGRDGAGGTPYMTGAGDVVVVWIREDLVGETMKGVAQMSTRSADHAFSKPINLSPAGSGAEYPNVAVNPSGATIAAWSRATNNDVLSVAGVQVALYTPGGPVSAPINLAPARQLVSGPGAAIDQSGNAIVVWARYRLAGEGGGPIQAAVYQDARLR